MLRSYFLSPPLPESSTPLKPSQSSIVFMHVYKLLCLFSNVQVAVMPCNFAFLPLNMLLSFPRWIHVDLVLLYWLLCGFPLNEQVLIIRHRLSIHSSDKQRFQLQTFTQDARDASISGWQGTSFP